MYISWLVSRLNFWNEYILYLQNEPSGGGGKDTFSFLLISPPPLFFYLLSPSSRKEEGKNLHVSG